MNLLVKGRLCLVVGAGNVAHRKVRNLLAHGARVVLVAPDAVPGLRELAASGSVVIREGRYERSLLEELGPFLVYAATDDDDENRRIVHDATEAGRLASSASCWEEGDFISPSVIRWGRGQVSITTEGASCRQARFMRIRLQELLGGERELFLLGVDRRTLGLEEFERVRPDAPRRRELVAMLRHLAALEEFVLLATCNRLEVYAWTRRGEGLEQAIRQILGLTPLEAGVYVKTGDDVVTHAANVVAGHFSEVACESQITGQFRDAFRNAFEEEVAGVHLQNLHDRVLTLGRRIRARQEVQGGNGVETRDLPDLVAEEVSRRIPLVGPRVLVLGAGGLGREVAGRLAALSELRLSWGNRSPDRIPTEPACEHLSLEDALGRLGAFDQVIAVLGAARPVIRIEHLEGMESTPVFIDLGVPRNVDPTVAEATGAEVVDLSHFRHAGTDREKLVALADAVLLESGASRG